MTEDYRNALEAYPNVKRLIRGLPEELWTTLLPETFGDLAAFEERLKAMRKRDKERQRVMNLQRACGFELRPNEFLHETETRARAYGRKFNDWSDSQRTAGNQGGWPIL